MDIFYHLAPSLSRIICNYFHHKSITIFHIVRIKAVGPKKIVTYFLWFDVQVNDGVFERNGCGMHAFTQKVSGKSIEGTFLAIHFFTFHHAFGKELERVLLSMSNG